MKNFLLVWSIIAFFALGALWFAMSATAIAKRLRPRRMLNPCRRSGYPDYIHHDQPISQRRWWHAIVPLCWRRDRQRITPLRGCGR